MSAATTPRLYTLSAHKAVPRELSIYIQSHGNHAGRPLRQPIPNCFTLTVRNTADLEKMWWLCVMLYRGNAYFPIIRGSVIPFITKNECRDVLDHGMNRVNQKPQSFTKAIKVLTAIDSYLELEKKRSKTMHELQLSLLSAFR